MDKAYLKQVIARLIAERAVHEHKFAGMPVHNNCLKRFDALIEKLEDGLGDERRRLDFSPSESALPDALEEASALKAAAMQLELEQQHASAEFLKQRAREVLFKEMNELDGFDR